MKKYLVVIPALLLFLSACNLPLLNQPETPVIPAPNLTMTAIVAQLSATPTLPPVVIETATATVAPSDTPAPTNTTEPTNTPQPTSVSPTITSSPTAVPFRSGKQIVAPYMKNPPVLDGTWDEWDAPQLPGNLWIYNKSAWDGPDDLDLAYRVAWDNTYLYVAVKVTDDKYVQNATGADLYKGDSIEILLDTDLLGDFYSTVLSADDYQLGISGGKGGEGLYTLNGPSEAYLWFPASVAGPRSQVKIAISRGITGDSKPAYRGEFAIPWSMFGVSPYNGMRLGFGVSASDNDNSSKNVQESMISNVPNRSLVNPTTWRELYLSK